MKKLKSLKHQYKQEEQAFMKIRKMHVDLSDLSDVKVLEYLKLSSREELISYVAVLQNSVIQKDEVHGEGSESLCTCADANGMVKILYVSKSEAQSMCALRNKEVGVSLSVYTCPVLTGWHLTKG